MMNVRKETSVKQYYRFVEFVSKMCGYSLTHERYKRIALDLLVAQSKQEIEVKRLSNAFVYVLNNSKQDMSKEIIQNIYYLLTNTLLNEEITNKILKKYYLNINCDVEHKVIYIHKLINSFEIARKIEFAFLVSNFLMLKDSRGVIIPHAAIFNQYFTNLKMDDEIQWVLLIKQMESNNDDNTLTIKTNCQELIEIIKPNINYIKGNFKVKTLCLYGGVVKGVINESSDIDFLVSFDDNLIDFERGYNREELENYLKELLKCKVDLVYFDHALSKLDISEMSNIIVLIKPEENI